jgi:hypothetical protein
MKIGKEKFNNKNDKPETLPEKEKRLVHEIEKLPMSVSERVNLLMVWRGFKSWTKLTYLYKTWGAGDPEPDLTPERKRVRVSEFNQLLGFMGLAAVASKEYRKEPSFEQEKTLPGKEYRDYYISSKLEIAEEMSNKSIEQEKIEFTEEIKNKIQKLSPNLYAEMIKEVGSR